MHYITINGKDYYTPCEDCKHGCCSTCLLNKYKLDYEEAEFKRESAEYKIQTELKPRLQAEARSYDYYVTTDKAAEWCDAFDYKTSELIDMFDEDFDFLSFDISENDIYSKIFTLILDYKKELKEKRM